MLPPSLLRLKMKMSLRNVYIQPKIPGITTQKTTLWYSHRCGNLISHKEVPVSLQAVA
jgi:hypothetical protein